MSDPFLIEGPALISFSGGRSSAIMLHRILAAHGGALPPDAVVGFANTGKEREETLRFVHEVASRWGVRVRWVEYRDLREEYARKEVAKSWSFEEVGFNSASRNGEPFDALINRKKALPNGRDRWCTQYLKVLILQDLMRSLGYGEPGDYLEPIGLRADEMDRVVEGRTRALTDGRRVVHPLAVAGVTKRDVRAFWWGEERRYETSLKPQGFDLELPDLWGNCDLCFAMGAAILEERVRQKPEVAPWWSGAEIRTGKRFATRQTVQDLIDRAAAHNATPDLLDKLDDSTECATWCGGSE